MRQVKGNGSCDPIVLGITISCRGIFAPNSASLLRKIGLVGDDFKVMAVKALEGTVRVFHQFMRSAQRTPCNGKRGQTNEAGAVFYDAAI